MNDRDCPSCGEPLTPHANEKPYHFARRRFCNSACASAAKCPLTVIDWIDIDADICAGEHTMKVLAERYDVNIKLLERRKTRLRRAGRRVRTPPPDEFMALARPSHGAAA